LNNYIAVVTPIYEININRLHILTESFQLPKAKACIEQLHSSDGMYEMLGFLFEGRVPGRLSKCTTRIGAFRYG
jgi:hypothetical protein